ncbi:ribonuclease H-like domain-containing protein [Tuber brumale]|nr:ribonuclease H-like domain-containing protein [Tuber brumale]
MATTALSSNWKQLQKTLKKPTSTTPTNPSKRKSSSTESPTASSSSSTIIRAKRTKRARTPRSTAANPPNLPPIPPVSKPTQTSKVLKMSAAAPKPNSAAVALWAEDNDISPADLRKAYNLPLTSTTFPPPTGSAIEPEASGSSSAVEPGKYISLDCEMVGVGGPTNERSALARVSIVNYHGHVILDTFVRPKERVTDWRSWVSGVTPAHMIHAREFEDVQKEVSAILTDRVLVGHAVKYDLEALLLSHPRRDIRDTSRHPGFRKFSAGRTPRLKKLALEVLGIEIQGGEHSSVEDARACMLLYRKFRDEIEKLHRPKAPKASTKSGRKNGGKKKKKKA